MNLTGMSGCLSAWRKKNTIIVHQDSIVRSDPLTKQKCCVAGCTKNMFRSRKRRQPLCRKHYERVRRYGGTGPVNNIGRTAPLEDRFINNVLVGGPVYKPIIGNCFQWTGYVHQSGFGAIGFQKKLIYVHRYAWERAHGSPPAGTRIRHICGNKLCVRVDHLTATNQATH